MGCFDFVYADTGKNTMGGKGYYLMPQKMQDVLGLKKNTIRIDGSDSYGILTTEYGDADIFDLYALQCVIQSLPENKAEEMKSELERLFNGVTGYTEIGRYNKNAFRELGISLFFDADTKTDNPEEVRTDMPLILIRHQQKKGEKYLYEKMENVTDDDPNQGFSPTKNYFVKNKSDNSVKRNIEISRDAEGKLLFSFKDKTYIEPLCLK